MKKLLLLPILLILLSCSEQSPQDTVKIVNYGQIEAELYESTKNREHIAGISTKAREFRIRENSNHLKPRMGLMFGIIYKFNNTKLNGHKSLEVVRFPKGGLKNAETGQVAYQTEASNVIDVKLSYLHGYKMSNDWEIRTGDWTFEVYVDDSMVVSKTITIN